MYILELLNIANTYLNMYIMTQISTHIRVFEQNSCT